MKPEHQIYFKQKEAKEFIIILDFQQKECSVTDISSEKKRKEVEDDQLEQKASHDLRWLIILGWNEGHLGDDAIVGLPTNDDLDFSSRLVETRLHVPHCYVLLQAGAESTAGHLADLFSAAAAQDLAVASWGWAV